jgi:glycyl-tRNA synthetase
VLAFICEAYSEDAIPDESGVLQPRVVLKLHPRLAPVKVAVFPLIRKEGMPEAALGLYRELKKRWNVDYDDKGSIGRRYRRQDELGTPYCITVDGQTMEDGTVTVRNRDTTVQDRMPLREIAQFLHERLTAA